MLQFYANQNLNLKVLCVRFQGHYWHIMKTINKQNYNMYVKESSWSFVSHLWLQYYDPL